MNKKLTFTIGSIAYIVSFILIIYYLILEFSIIDIYPPLYRLITIGIIIIFMYIGGLLLKQTDNKTFNKIYKMNLYVWFILFVAMILNLTLFDKYFNRHIAFGHNDFEQYIEYNFNLHPFHTIDNYIIALKNHNLTKLNFFYNIFGNIIAFVPLSLFIPRIFKKIDTWYKFLMTSCFCIILVEILQMLTRSGSCDIDDFILNIIGAMFFYIVFNNKFINKKIDKYLFLKDEEKNE